MSRNLGFKAVISFILIGWHALPALATTPVDEAATALAEQQTQEQPKTEQQPQVSAEQTNAEREALLMEQRRTYLAANNALRKGHLRTYRRLRKQLDDYPLASYLDYLNLRRRLYTLPFSAVDEFLTANEGTYISDQLRKRWLTTLFQQKRWKDYQRYFVEASSNTTLQCYQLLARHYSGDESAMLEVPELWNVGISQPDECDPLFFAWQQAGYLTGDIAWERHRKALQARNRKLARYIAKRMPAELQSKAALYLEVDISPERLTHHARFKAKNSQTAEIVLHGLRRLSQRDSLAALEQWNHYRGLHEFPEAEQQATLEYLITRLARDGNMESAKTLMASLSKIENDELIAWLVRDALRRQSWPEVYSYINLFPLNEQGSDRWLYWRARAMAKLDIADPNYLSPTHLYNTLALKRSFYGFLAADLLGQNYSLLDRPVQSSPLALSKVRELPAIIRAKELLAIDNLRDARREWLYATRELDEAQLLAAGKLAEEWGWYRKSIQAVVAAEHWDDLQLRFPLGYQQQVANAAQVTQIEPPLLFAITRQECAFAADAKSSAGAMGLMQLMPATAREVAKNLGVKYRYWDLIKPEQNIEFGSTYLNQLLQQFGGNRILATAAYNAGPHRVKKWLGDNEQIPFDIWIETIPFRETRHYVQNVLQYSVIYGYRLGLETSLLSESDAKHPVLTTQ